MKITSAELGLDYGRWTNGSVIETELVCSKFLNKHFEIPAGTTRLWVSLSTRRTKHSLGMCFRDRIIGGKVLEGARSGWIVVNYETTQKVLETFKENQTLYLTVEYI